MPIPGLLRPALRTPGRLLASTLLLASLTLPVGASDGAERIPVATGDRVRVVLYDRPPVAGRLLAFDARAVELVAEPESVRRVLSREAIVGIEVEREGSRAGRGAAIGFLAGGLAGIGVASARAGDGDIVTTPATAFVTGALVGALAGALVGRVSSTRSWRAATFP